MPASRIPFDPAGRTPPPGDMLDEIGSEEGALAAGDDRGNVEHLAKVLEWLFAVFG